LFLGQFDFGPRLKITVDALSVLDPFTGLLELSKLSNKTCAHVATVFHIIWLCRYPTPTSCIHDNGPEFIAQEFQDVLRYYGIKDVPTTSKNPQANSIIEHVHLTMGYMLRALILETRSRNQQPLPVDLEDFVDTSLACTKHAINATVHSATKESPGAFVFQLNIILPIQSFANWELAHKSHSEMIHRNLLRENNPRRPFDWQPGMEVLINFEKKKMDAKYIGPFPITRVHTNGNVTVQHGNSFQRVNIRRIKLYHHR
jgi:Integrase core domain.